MGMQMFVKDGVFYPSTMGLYEGDVINVVLVAAGHSAASSAQSGTQKGGNSSFGTYAVAIGGAGAAGCQARSTAPQSGAGGGGGFVPGAVNQGGNGMTGQTTLGSVIPPVYLPFTNSGGFRGQYHSVYGGNGANCGGGQGYSTYIGEGGAGYGAGGGACNNDNYISGPAGQIVYYSRVLTATDITNGIPVTIGAGGTYQSGGYIAALYSTGNVTGFKVTDYTPMLDGVGGLGSFKTFELADGTYGITPASSQYQQVNTTSYVKFMGKDSLLSFSTAFPSPFTNASSAPIQYCNGYYIQCVPSAGGTTVRYITVAKAQSGSAVTGDVGTVTYGSGWCAAGATATDLVVLTSTSNYNHYANWTPASSPVARTTSGGNMTWVPASGGYNYLTPYQAGLIQWKPNNSGYNTYSGPYYLGNLATGAVANTGTTTINECAFMYQTVSGAYPYCTINYLNSNYYYQEVAVFSPAGPVTSPYVLSWFFGTTTRRYFNCNHTSSANGYGYAFAPLAANGVGVWSPSGSYYPSVANWNTIWTPIGYNNVGGEQYGMPAGNMYSLYGNSQFGGGAGGCCMVTW